MKAPLYLQRQTLFQHHHHLNLCDFRSFQTACGLTCYQCVTTDPKSCTTTVKCPPELDRCSTVEFNGNKLFMTIACIQAFAKFQLFLHSQLLFSLKLNLSHLCHYTGLVTKTCMANALCISPIKCCTGDLCNGAASTGSSVLLLLVPTAIMSVFLWGSEENLPLITRDQTFKNDSNASKALDCI